jgi:hypothetical protein
VLSRKVNLLMSPHKRPFAAVLSRKVNLLVSPHKRPFAAVLSRKVNLLVSPHKRPFAAVLACCTIKGCTRHIHGMRIHGHEYQDAPASFQPDLSR